MSDQSPYEYEGSAINGSKDTERKQSVTADKQMGRAKTICIPQIGGRQNKLLDSHSYF